jgi:acyl-CoA reductase-like NAD-dependent aldehyde dehydrogenase
MVVGDPLDARTEMGAPGQPAPAGDHLRYIESGKSEGATLACGGERDREGVKAKGNFLKPTVFTDVQPHMRIAQEEIFGPVLSVMRLR